MMQTKRSAGLVAALCVLISFVVVTPSARAAALEDARVSRVIQDVRLLGANAAPRPATINDDVKQGMAVRTGAESRAELTFTDQTITRLGQNTVFSIKGGTREVNLDSGAILLSVPHGGEAAQVRTAAVTASITGGTTLISSNPGYPKKMIVLEGVGHLCRTPVLVPGQKPRTDEDCVEVHAGEMVMLNTDGTLSKPEKIHTKLVYTTSRLLTDFPALANDYLILLQINEEEGSGDGTSQSNQDDTLNKTDQAAAASTPTSTPGGTPTPTPGGTPTPTPGGTPTPTPGGTPTPTPAPGKFGPPNTISSPDPYTINSGTVITTDPTITTNGQTDNGTIYRDRATDGLFSLWAFGSTSVFDTSSGFDDQIGNNNGGNERPGGAVFKFNNLVLAGDPTVDTTNGPISLGLIAVNSITSSAAGQLAFGGIRGLLLATVNGPITLDSETSFSIMHDMTIYARGATSDLTLGSDVSTGEHVDLYAERDMVVTSSITTEQFFAVTGRDLAPNASASSIDAVTISMSAGHDLTLSGFFSDQSAENSSGDVTLKAGHNIFSPDAITIRRSNGGTTDGMSVTLDAIANNLTVGQAIGDKAPSGVDIEIDNSSSDLDKGANITLHAGRNLSTENSGDLFLLVTNSSSGHIADGGNISITTGNNLTTQGLNLTVDNSLSGLIDSGGNISVTTGDVTAGGGLTAFSINALIDSRGGGSISSGGSINFSISGALTTTNGAIFQILDGNAGATGIDVNGTSGRIDVSAASIDVGGTLLAKILNNDNPFASQGKVTVHSDGDITVGGDIDSWGKVTAGTESSAGNITVGGIVSVPEVLSANGSISVTGGLFAFTVSATDTVTVGATGATGGTGSTASLHVNELTATSLNMVNVADAGPVSESSFGDINYTPDDMNWTVDSIVTTGPAIPTLKANGADASPDFGNNNPGNGGKITLTINNGGLTLGSAGTFNYIQANGGNYNDVSTMGGSAGTVHITTTGDVTLNNGDNNAPAITTLTGLIPTPAPLSPQGTLTRGNGGTVTIDSAGTVTVNSTVQVSSNDSIPSVNGTSPPVRRSATGGDLSITSTKTSGSAITVNSSAQLLSLLNNAAPGPGGKITLVASNTGTNATNGGNNSTIDIDNANGDTGAITAERGTVEIRHDGDFGVINISNANIAADIVKIGALGTNGVLNIGGGFISADTMLKLYATGSSGTINFIANVSLNGASTKIIAANTVNIMDGVTVHIDMAGAAVSVYTNHPNYSTDFGGNGTHTGTFDGAGANNPTPLATPPPPFDAGAGGGRTGSGSGGHNPGGTVFRQVDAPVRENGAVSIIHIRSPMPTNSMPLHP
ncbi:MAG: FecR domain-containing protein [Verrucomicrobiota bacterium]